MPPEPEEVNSPPAFVEPISLTYKYETTAATLNGQWVIDLGEIEDTEGNTFEVWFDNNSYN